MVQHGLVLSKKIVVLRQLISASALLALSTFSSITAVQAQVGPKPASEAEMTLYTRISALNACIAAANGVDFNKSIGIAGETLTQVLQGQNGGAIQQLGAKDWCFSSLPRSDASRCARQGKAGAAAARQAS